MQHHHKKPALMRFTDALFFGIVYLVIAPIAAREGLEAAQGFLTRHRANRSARHTSGRELH